MAYFRYPRTKQEKTVAAADVVDGVKRRGKRSIMNIPDSYDDLRVAAWTDRSWKRLRKLKWRRIFDV